MIGCDVRNMTAETLEIISNKEVIDINQDSLGIQGRKVHVSGKYGCQQVWAGPLSGHRLVVALWNRCSKAATITVGWEVIGLESTVNVSIRDLWKHEDLSGTAVGSSVSQVAAHDCEMYIFTPGSAFRSAI